MSSFLSPIQVQLTIESGDRRVPAVLTFRNVSMGPALLNKINCCENGRIQHDLFVIASKTGEVDYTGPYFRRRQPELSPDFLELAPGEAFTVRVFLAETYDFPAGAAEYAAHYEAFDPAAPLDDIWEMRSAPEQFEIPA